MNACVCACAQSGCFGMPRAIPLKRPCFDQPHSMHRINTDTNKIANIQVVTSFAFEYSFYIQKKN